MRRLLPHNQLYVSNQHCKKLVVVKSDPLSLTVVGMVLSGPPGLSAAALAVQLLIALASVVMADNSCFDEFAIARLYKTKYEVCKGDNNIECKCTVSLLLLSIMLYYM